MNKRKEDNSGYSNTKNNKKKERLKEVIKMSTGLKIATGVVVGTFVVCGAVAITSYCKIVKSLNQFAADADSIMEDVFGVNDEKGVN